MPTKGCACRALPGSRLAAEEPDEGTVQPKEGTNSQERCYKVKGEDRKGRIWDCS